MGDSKRHFVIGTAGHIDHGKTAMVKRLTGKDTDWLKEEKERGMTIDLGFAFLGDDITIIDVPGHEKFVRNMVAGVSTVDLVLLVIAADDGIMPQTREHLDILKLLQIKQGIVVITKTDLVEPDWLELVIDEAKELMKNTFLENSIIIPVSNETGEGIVELKEQIMKLVAEADTLNDKGIFRMPIDRVFTMKGFGTVAAGTVLSGSLSVDQTVELLPRGKKLRVRGMQKHEHSVKMVKMGDRAAINIASIDKNEVHRGDVLAEVDYFRGTKYFDGKFYLLKSASRELKHNARIRLNIGTSEVIGRVSILDKNEISPGEESFIQFRLEKPVVADVGDRYVLRSYSPVITIGGGAVLDVNPKRHKRFSDEVLKKIKDLESGSPASVISHILLQAGNKFTTATEIAQQAVFNLEKTKNVLKELIEEKRCFCFSEKGQSYYLNYNNYLKLSRITLKAISDFHQKNPTRRGISRSDLKVTLDIEDVKVFNFILDELIRNDEITITDNRVALKSFKMELDGEQKKSIKKIAQIYYEDAYKTLNAAQIADKINMTHKETKVTIDILLETGELVNVGEGIIFHKKRIDEAIEKVKEYFSKNDKITVADFRQLLDSSRKYAVPLLNHFDGIGLTARQGDVRVLNPDFFK